MMNVLLVDDDAPTRASLSELLESSGYHVICAANGADALALLAVNGVELVISDWSMPLLDGLQLCEELRANLAFRSLSIVLMSSDSAPDLHGLWDAFFRKPFAFPELDRAIQSLAGSAAAKVALDDDLPKQVAIATDACPATLR